MKKRIAGLLFALVLCLTLLPSAASAADGDDVVYVGGVELTGSTDNPVYATTDASGNVITEGASADDYNVKWDGATLTLNGAYITDGHDITPILTNGIYSNGSLNIVLTGTNTITRAAEPQAYYHVFGISTGSDLSITGSDETAKLIISGSDAADHGSTGINAGSRLYIKNCVIHSSGHDEIEPGYTGIFAEEDLIIANSTVTAESTGVYGCGMYSYAGDIRIDEASHVTATSEAEGGAVKLSDSGALYVGDAAYEQKVVISDLPKADAKNAIAALKAAGVRRTVMLTGDAREVAAAVAAQLGVDEFHAELLPADKVALTEQLLASTAPGTKLAFVGDGINDAPVLTRADIGIAMGAMGSDAAIEAADIVLMDDKPSKIAQAMAIARQTVRIVRENIVFALGVKAAVLILGALGDATMWAAVFADVGVAVIAILNAMRALRVPRTDREKQA